MRDIIAETLEEVNGHEVEDRSTTIDIYIDGSCLDNDRPSTMDNCWLGCVRPQLSQTVSVTLGEYYGALPDTNQTTNNRSS